MGLRPFPEVASCATGASLDSKGSCVTVFVPPALDSKIATVSSIFDRISARFDFFHPKTTMFQRLGIHHLRPSVSETGSCEITTAFASDLFHWSILCHPITSNVPWLINTKIEAFPTTVTKFSLVVF